MLFSSNTFCFFGCSFYDGWGIWNYFKIQLLPLGSLSSTVSIGKEKQLTKRHQKGSQDRSGEFIFLERLIWWEVPALFNTKNIGKTLVTRIQEAKLYLMTSGSVLKVRLAYLQTIELQIIIKNVLGKNCLCNSQEMYFVVEQMCSTLQKRKKWKTVLETSVFTSTDGYLLCHLCVAF